MQDFGLPEFLADPKPLEYGILIISKNERTVFLSWVPNLSVKIDRLVSPARERDREVRVTKTDTLTQDSVGLSARIV